MCAIELPGRWVRRAEPTIDSMSVLVELITESVLSWTDVPFSIYGHSMGALLGFELARSIRRRTGQGPRALIVGAHIAPHLPTRLPAIGGLPDQAFLAACAARYGGLDPKHLQDPEIRAMLLSPMRADMRALEGYRFRPEEPLDSELHVLGGRADRLTSDEALSAWFVHTRGRATMKIMPGGHLFLKECEDDVLVQVRAALRTI